MRMSWSRKRRGSLHERERCHELLLDRYGDRSKVVNWRLSRFLRKRKVLGSKWGDESEEN